MLTGIKCFKETRFASVTEIFCGFAVVMLILWMWGHFLLNEVTVCLLKLTVLKIADVDSEPCQTSMECFVKIEMELLRKMG